MGNLRGKGSRPALSRYSGRGGRVAAMLLKRRRVWIIGPVGVLLVLIGGWWLVQRFVLFNFHEELPGRVYRSAQPSAAFLRRVVSEYHMRCVIKLNRAAESSWSRDEEQTTKELGVRFIHAPVGVTELPSRWDMLRVLNAIESAPEPVLIHCKNGADRTSFASVMVAMRQGASLEEAWQRQTGLRFLRVGHIGAEISDVFSQYRADVGARYTGDWPQLRQYIVDSYWPDFYHAVIEPDPVRIEARPGQVIHFNVKVTNASPRPWKTSGGHPFFLALHTISDPADYHPEHLVKQPLPELAPSQSVTVELPFTVPQLSPGEHRYVIDVVQKEVTTFFERGSSPADVTIVVP
jgi:protein tyrosine phosphatase (PTP) superfamily phosphohydrolase (DUF442 family)